MTKEELVKHVERHIEMAGREYFELVKAAAIDPSDAALDRIMESERRTESLLILRFKVETLDG